MKTTWIKHHPHDLIAEPTENDVLCGRGGLSNKHKGNILFRALVQANKEAYMHRSPHNKAITSKSIVLAICQQNPPGRFIRKDPVTGLWCEVGDQEALRKTSQALREVPPLFRNLAREQSLPLPEPLTRQATGSDSPPTSPEPPKVVSLLEPESEEDYPLVDILASVMPLSTFSSHLSKDELLPPSPPLPQQQEQTAVPKGSHSTESPDTVVTMTEGDYYFYYDFNEEDFLPAVFF